MKRVLITGCAGMIGSNLAHYLLGNTDWEIVGIDNMSGGYLENINDIVTGERMMSFHVGDCNSKLLDRLFEVHKFDLVYHCAAYAAEGLSPFIRKFNYTNNIVETAAIVNQCIEHDTKLVFFSSIAVYGHGRQKPPFRETHVPAPIDPYGIAKYACELDIQAASKQHDLKYTIVRPFNVYGEYQNIWDKYRNVFGIWMYNQLNGLPITIFGDGTQTRNFTYVKDILPALCTLGRRDKYNGSIFNLGAPAAYSIADAAQIFASVVGTCEVQFLPERHEVHDAWPDVTKCEHLLDGPTSLAEGLIRMWRWAKQQPAKDRCDDFEGKYEITKGMYKVWKD
jgi:UDP-glucose 4-epimerase